MLFSYQFFIISIIFPLCSYSVFCCDSCSWHSHQYVQHLDRKFEQKTNTFWEFEDQSRTWIQVKLPYDLVSCINDDCTKVGSIINKKTTTQNSKQESNDSHEVFLPLKKKIGSLRVMSDTSIWVIGQSGSIYERFWNGLRWVTAPHELPIAAGPAVSGFMVNHTILAMSLAGNLYQMRLNEDSQAEWIDLKPILNPGIDEQTEQSSGVKLTSGVISYDKKRIYFCSKSGSLLELSETDPVRWINHGQPSGADVAVIVDAEMFKPKVIFTISSKGHLYEYDKSPKTSWKKHIQKQGSTESTSLATSTGCTLLGASRTHWISLFLLTKGGELVERRLHQRKWKWLVHGKPGKYPLTSITCTSTTKDVLTENSISLFLTTASGDIYEYRESKQSGMDQENEYLETWENHKHPPYAKVAIGVPGIQLQVGRMMFPLDDGRVAELHLQGLGGEISPINQKFNTRKKKGFKFEWSILDAPESEGWNAQYCTGERGPVNCITGTREEYVELDDARSLSISKRRRIGVNAGENYLPVISTSEIRSSKSSEYSSPFPENNWINTNFRLRQMHGRKSVFVVSDDGVLYEFLSNDNMQLWLRNDEQSTTVRGIVGSYNGSLYVVDEHGSLLLIKDMSINEEMAWKNCTAMKKGKKVIAGPPWNGVSTTATLQDAIFFISTTGKLLQLTVSLGNFKWKNCKNPQSVKIACIVDQEEFRRNIVFVVGRNGRLYQYNKITELWHEHYQSKHLSLSRVPGTTMRPSSSLTKGSIFMISVDGGLVEYKFNTASGWDWIEHGTPSTSVILAGSPGPSFSGLQLFVIGSDGGAYLRYYDDQAIWRWENLAFPFTEENVDSGINKESETLSETERLQQQQQQQHTDEHCDRKVDSTRPIPVTEDSVIFQLRDGRLAEMGKNGEGNWKWKRTIATPTSKCMDHLWTTLAS